MSLLRSVEPVRAPRRRRAAGVRAAALACVAFGAAAFGQGASDPVEHEWRIRARALDLAAARAELDADLADARAAAWPLRRAALDAIARGLAVGSAEPAVLAWADERARAAAADPHPNVRAAALDVCAALGPPTARGAAETAALVAALARDAFPAVRAGVARALEGEWSGEAARVLGALALDPDAGVAEHARASLFPLPAGGPAAAAEREAVLRAQLDALRALASVGDDALLEALRLWSRAGGDPALPAAFRAWLQRAGALGPERARAWCAVAAALELAARAADDVPPEGELLRELAAALFDGWLGAGEWSPRRQALLAGAGACAGAEGLGDDLLRALSLAAAAKPSHAGGETRFAAFDAEIRAHLADGRESEIFHLRYDLFEALLRYDGPAGLAERLARREPPPATLAFALPELGLRTDAWSVERDGRWLARERPRDVRAAAAEAFAHTLSAEADPAAAELLARALADADPIVVRIAFRALCEAPAELVRLEALRGAFDRADPDERLQLLAWLPRERPLVPFRDVLSAGSRAEGAEAAPLRALATELLGTFSGDGGIAAELARELARALEALEAEEAAAEPGASMQPRERELRVNGLLRALDQVERPIDPARAEAALTAALGRSTEVGKVAAGLLARGPEPARLAAYLGDAVDRRTRIEAAIGLAQRSRDDELRGRAAARLSADLDAAAWDLRVRMIDALGASGAPSALARLGALALDGERAAEDQKRALEALAAAGELGPVARVAGSSGDAALRRDAEVRMVALGLLAARGVDLEPILVALPDERILDADRERLRLFLLKVGAERGSLTAARERELCAGPLAAARATQAARFAPPRAGAPRVPEPAFEWRFELDALEALARRDASSGALARLVDADARARLDGRFLAELGERALRAGAAEDARTLLRAAVVALHGDVDAPAAKAQALTCRLLALAWTTERYAEAARLADALGGAYRARRIADAVWEGAFGVADPARGLDPPARVTASAAQARAFAALRAGDRGSARRHADAAAGLLGASRLGAQEQARLEAELER